LAQLAPLVYRLVHPLSYPPLLDRQHGPMQHRCRVVPVQLRAVAGDQCVFPTIAGICTIGDRGVACPVDRSGHFFHELARRSGRATRQCRSVHAAAE